ncbi:FMN-binding protein [Mesorhizobium sp. B4-1-3]|nr:FMN-binding protein [Mesorhizobium sp. B4-1-3]
MKQIALSLFVIASSGAYVWDQAGKAPSGEVIDTASANTAEEAVEQPIGPAPASATAVAPPAVPLPAMERRSVRPPATPPAMARSETTAAIAAPASTPSAAATPTAAEKSPFAVGQLSPTSIPPAKQTPAGLVDDAAPPTAVFAVTPTIYIPIPRPRPDYPRAVVRIIKAGMKPSVNPATKAAGHRFTDGTYAGPVTDAYYGHIQIQASIQSGRLTSLKVLKYPNDRRTSININRQALPMLRDEAISAQSANVDIISGATLTSKAFRQSLAGALKQAST